MKKWINIILAVVLVLSFTGCSKNDSSVDVEENTAREEVVDSSIKEVETVSYLDKIDVDLTKLSSTMIYGEVYNMMAHPEEYVGKKVKIFGEYYTAESSVTDVTYHYIIVKDATACCQGGLEFKGSSYPEEGTEAEITGTFTSYEELGETYYYIDVV